MERKLNRHVGPFTVVNMVEMGKRLHAVQPMPEGALAFPRKKRKACDQDCKNCLRLRC